MLSGNCTEALSIQANVTISGSSKKLIKNDLAPLPFPLPALLKQYWYIKRGERVRVRGHAPFYPTLGLSGSNSAQPQPTRYWLRETPIVLPRNSDKQRRVLLRRLFVIDPFKRKGGRVRSTKPQDLKLIEG